MKIEKEGHKIVSLIRISLVNQNLTNFMFPNWDF